MNVDILKDAKKQTEIKHDSKRACVYIRLVYVVMLANTTIIN